MSSNFRNGWKGRSLNMAEFWDIAMGIWMDAGLLIWVLHLARSIRTDASSRGAMRIMSVLLGAGMLFALAARYRTTDCAVLWVYVLGAMLCYTAFVFTFPRRAVS